MIDRPLCRYGGEGGQAGEGAGGQEHRQGRGPPRGSALRELQRRRHRERDGGGGLPVREVKRTGQNGDRVYRSQRWKSVCNKG